MDCLFLVDGSNFLFRAYHAMPPLTTQKGVPTGAVRGFLSMLVRLIGDHLPSHLAVVFDAGGRDKRAELFAEYKKNRTETPPDLLPQFDLARQVVTALGLCSIDATDVEADDVIATLARRAQGQGLKVTIVSSDKDLMQLCCAGQIDLLDTMKEEGRGKLYGPPEVIEKFGVPPEQLGDVLALMGDSSDNLPGIPGVGQKTAAQLIQSFGSIDKLLAGIDTITVRGKDKIQAALREHGERLRLVRQLVALDEQVPATLGLGDLQRQPARKAELVMLMKELEFNTLLKRLTQPGGLPGLGDLSDAAALSEALGPMAPAIPSTAATATTTAAANPAGAKGADSPALPSLDLDALIRSTPASTRIVLDTKDLAEAVAAVRAAVEHSAGACVAVLPVWCDEGSAPKGHSARLSPLCGLTLCAAGLAPIYVPLAHRYLGVPAQLGTSEVFAAGAPLRDLLEDERVPKVVYGAKEVHQGLASCGVRVRGVKSDPALDSYLLDPAKDHDLHALIKEHLPAEFPSLPSREALVQSGKHRVPFDQVDHTRAAELLGAEARAVLFLGLVLQRKLDGAAQHLLAELELPLAEVLAEIEGHGVLIDVEVLRQLSKEAEARLAALESEITREAGGVSVNLNSPRQLAELLFEKLGLDPVKKTKGKTAQSVDAEVLEHLAADHPIARHILEHRSLSKLKGTYLDAFPGLINPRTGRLHTAYQQVVAATGRLSSTEPNLQNIPVRSEMGAKIRRAFIAPPGHLLIAADYSQIELRVLAHLSGDPLLTESFQKGEDVHTRTALEMFGPVEGAKPDRRRAAKMINYGIVYGLTDYGLATRLGIERRLAKEYIEEYFARYRRVKQFMEELVLRARADGGARTLLGRFRPLPELTSRIYTVRGYAERMAKNTPVQGTAADILKRAMIDVQAALKEREPAARMLLTVHDELVLEAPEPRRDAVCELVKAAMERAATLSVPLQVDVGAATNWADC